MSVEIIVFGRKGCPGYEPAKRVVKKFFKKVPVSNSFRALVYDVDTVDGMTEAAFYDVFRLPSTLVRDEFGKIVERWDGTTPSVKELTRALSE